MEFKLTKKNLTNTGLTKRQVDLLTAPHLGIANEQRFSCGCSGLLIADLYTDANFDWDGLLMVQSTLYGFECRLFETDFVSSSWVLDYIEGNFYIAELNSQHVEMMRVKIPLDAANWIRKEVETREWFELSVSAEEKTKSGVEEWLNE